MDFPGNLPVMLQALWVLGNNENEILEMLEAGENHSLMRDFFYSLRQNVNQ